MKHCLFVIVWLLFSLSARANDCSVEKSGVLELPFESGAQWHVCWHIDELAGLVLSDVLYGAPDQPAIRLLDSASVAQVLVKYDEDTDPTHVLSESGLGGSHLVKPIACDDGELLTQPNEQQICMISRYRNVMTKVRGGDSFGRQEVILQSWSKIENSIYKQAWNLSEDGEITPSITLSGKLSRFTTDKRFGVTVHEQLPLAATSTMLVNWRLDFNINGTADNDLVDEIEFQPGTIDKTTRSMRVTPLREETARTVLRENFRGWRISDESYSSGTNNNITRIGYYLDPRTSGYREHYYDSPWSQFDLFVTRKNDCEQLSSGNQSVYPECEDDLTGYVDEESLEHRDPVVWFSVARHFVPDAGDYPQINAFEINFSLVPFDWSAHSPFGPPDKPQGSTIQSDEQWVLDKQQ